MNANNGNVPEADLTEAGGGLETITNGTSARFITSKFMAGVPYSRRIGRVWCPNRGTCGIARIDTVLPRGLEMVDSCNAVTTHDPCWTAG